MALLRTRLARRNAEPIPGGCKRGRRERFSARPAHIPSNGKEPVRTKSLGDIK